ncbi:MAG TPA: tetratricopeptide repeat protein [Bryobacteraceae bacterium]|nr:tetratricopeptide repeat protein [Bryobacteraceae bacterium]
MKRLWLLLTVALYAAESSSTIQETLWKHRNLGKAYYENPTTQQQAVDEFRKALALAPNSARERLNFGLALLRAGKTQEALTELEKVQKQDPKLPHTYFNLGITFRKQGEFDKAIPQFQKMIELVPNEPVAHYNLGVLYKQTGKEADAIKELETAEHLNPSLAAPHFQLFNLYRQAGRAQDASGELATFQRLKKEQEGAVIPEDMEWSDFAEIYDPKEPTATEPWHPGVQGIWVDLQGNGKPVLLTWTASGIKGAAGLEDLHDVVSVAQGDFDNDGLPDLCVLTEQAPLLMHNAAGRYEKAPITLPQGRFDKAIWLDFDHDYDLDLLLLGGKNVLLRNQGPAGFADHTADFPFVAGHAIDAASYRLMADSKAFDLMVSYADHPGVLYRDNLGGKYEAVNVPELPAGAKALETLDVNRDGWLDLVSSAGTLLNRNGKLDHVAQPVSDGSVSSDKPPAKGHWIRVQLAGVKNLKLGYDAEVEVKSGTLYEKKMYLGVPLIFDLGTHTVADTVRTTWGNGLIQNETNQAADRSYNYKEAQRLSGSCPMIWTWNGKQFQFISDVLGVAPLGASSGDGEYFPVDHDEYIQIPGDQLTAVNGRFNVNITEELSEVSYLDQVELTAVDHPTGTDVFTSERWKGPPFPEFHLYGVTHRIYPKRATSSQVGPAVSPAQNVLPQLLARDKKYVDTFRHDHAGVAEPHNLDLDFGPDAARSNKAVLVLNGWVDWADGSTFLAASQEGKGGLIPPYLQVRDATGQWKTVIEDMGMPDGKPKTIAVDLTGKFLTASREIRIVTNLCVFWDEIFLGDDASAPRATMTMLPMESATLHFRGFSKPVIDPDRRTPETFLYNIVSPATSWNQTPGLYTRYGDVYELITAVDDRLVILGSGDEMQMHFAAASLPPLPNGWKRDYLLKVDGWAKDRDANTAFSQSVEPIPFHAMSRYPYPSVEHFPSDAAHRAYRSKYNTRPAATLIPPLYSSK